MASGVGGAEAQKFLEQLLGRTVEAFELAGEGAWSRCYGYLDGGKERVIRFGRYLDDFERDLRASTFHSPALPVPRLYQIGRAFDGHFAISSRARGVPLESLSADGWLAVLPALFDALDAIRAIDLSGSSGYGDWDAHEVGAHASWRDFLLAVDLDTPERRTYGWRQRLIDSPIGDELFCKGLARLARLADPGLGPRYVVHADLINRNVLVEDGRIGGIFDWGCSFYGDFLYDLAWLAFWAPWFSALADLSLVERARAHLAQTGTDVPDFERRMRICMLHIGLDHLAYNAHTGDSAELVRVAERLLPLIEAP
jgi:hygromycin-B 4-O-kinase